jgi:hypothetical protein
MSKLIFFIPSIVLIAMMVLVITLARHADERTIRIDCTIAEISPDIPVEAKELCRKHRSGRI